MKLWINDNVYANTYFVAKSEAFDKFQVYTKNGINTGLECDLECAPYAQGVCDGYATFPRVKHSNMR